MSFIELFGVKEAFRHQMRRLRRANFRRPIGSAPVIPHAARFTLEALEPRLLLSATPTEVVATQQQLEPAAVTVPQGALPSLDVDLNGQADALTDGILIIRHLFGFTGHALVDGAVDPAGQRTDPAAIKEYLNSISPALDVDLNQRSDALSDGIMIVRSLFGFTGAALTSGALDPAGQRTDPAAIAAFLDNLNPARELVAPTLTAGLQQDTGLSATDAITLDPTITGTLADMNQIASFTAGFDATPVGSFVDVLADLQPGGGFTLSPMRLNQLAGGALADGAHTLHLRVTDARGNVAIADQAFVLDRMVVMPQFDLDFLSDMFPLGDGATTIPTVTVQGVAEAHSQVSVVPGGPSVSASAEGAFVLSDVSLVPGENVVELRSVDIAGNEAVGRKTIRLLDESVVAMSLQLALDTGASMFDRLTSEAVVMGMVTGPSPVTSLRARVEPAVLSGVVPAFQVLSPDNGGLVSSGTVMVRFATANVMIGDPGDVHVNVYLDQDPVPYRFYNGMTRQVIYGGAEVPLLFWQDESSMLLQNLSEGSHVLRCELADPVDLPLVEQAVVFTVAPAPLVAPSEFSNILAAGMTDHSAVVSWSTVVPGDSQVEFGVTSSYGVLTPLDPAVTTEHRIVLSGLQPDTTYHFRVRSQTPSGVLQGSSDLTVTTAAAPFLSGGADVTDLLRDGRFLLDETRLAQLKGGRLGDGTYRVTVQGEWQPGRLTAPYDLFFTLDRTPPVVLHSTLSEGAVVPDSLGIIQLHFSEPMDPAGISSDHIQLRTQTGVVSPVSIRLAPDGRVVTQSYGTLALEPHQFILHSSALRDAAGNALVVNEAATNVFVAAGGMPLRVSPVNSRYFVDSRGATVYLTGAHTWANIQDLLDPFGPFDFDAHLEYLAELNHNFIRGWAWEGSTADDWGRFASPLFYQRTGPGLAQDGMPKFDLTLFDQEYFDRLRSRVIAAGQRGIYVSVMLFDGWSVNRFLPWRDPWVGHSFNGLNNINGIDGDIDRDGEGEETHTLAIPEVVALQEAYVRKVVDTLNDLNNVLFEISNESGADSTEWQYHMIRLIKDYEAGKPKQHPVGMTYQWPAGDNTVLFDSPADWISPNAGGGDANNPPPTDGRKVIIYDTDHLGPVSETWVWKAFTRGYNPILMDWYGADSPWYSANHARTLMQDMGSTLQYAKRVDLSLLVPHGEVTSSAFALADIGRTYLIYQPDAGSFTVDLAGFATAFAVEWFDPLSETFISASPVLGDATRIFQAPFDGPAVLYLSAISSASPLSLPSEQVADTRPGASADALTGLDLFRRRHRFSDMTGEGMTVAVIDTGIDVDHPFFGPDADHNGVADRILYQWDFADNDADASDRVGHGSHIASLIGSEDLTYPGVAPEADLIALKVFKDAGAGTFAFVEQALQWVVAHAAEYSIDVVNLSLGDGQNWAAPGAHYGLGDEFAALANDGIILVAASGNNYFSAQSRPGVSYPAADPNVIGVGGVWTQDFGGPWRWSSGAIDFTTGSDRITSFSQRDATMTDIFAPGARLVGANQSGGTVTMQGTSQAAAYLSGTALLAQQMAEDELGRRLTPQEFTDLAVVTGKPIVDGDDEQDNVVNTGLTFSRVDMLQLAKGVHRFAAWERGEEGHDHREHGFALAYAQRCWVKDFVSESSTATEETGEEILIALT